MAKKISQTEDKNKSLINNTNKPRKWKLKYLVSNCKKNPKKESRSIGSFIIGQTCTHIGIKSKKVTDWQTDQQPIHVE